MNEMSMLRWMCGVTKKVKIRNEHVRRSVEVASVTMKITENINGLGFSKSKMAVKMATS